MSTSESNSQITCCPAGRGVLWWSEAFRMVKEAIAPWFLLGLAYVLILVLPMAFFPKIVVTKAEIGLVGFLPTIFAPCFVVGFVAAGWSQTRGETPRVSHFFNGFKSDVIALLGIGLVKAVLLFLSYLLVFQMLGKELATLVAASASEGKSAELTLAAMLSLPSLWMALFAWASLMTLIWMAGWLAPMVVVFQRAGVVTAMLRSFKAVLANWRALLVYGLVLIAVILVFWFLISMIVFALGAPYLEKPEHRDSLVGIILAAALLTTPLLFSTTILASFVAYCDIFHAADRVFPRPPDKSALF